MKQSSPNHMNPAASGTEILWTAQKVFPIVGIGASAGGLQALEAFLGRVPAHCGAAFVVVQHLDPTQKDLLAELLQRKTSMRVSQITDRMPVEPDQVYVIPPNRDLSILNGVLYLLEPAESRGLRLPIDAFLRSLADDQQAQGIGVILSGMGSDGTLGLRAVKEKGGAVFVQAPTSTQFDGMPRSAIGTGLADVVAPAQELGEKIDSYLKHIPTLTPRADHKPGEADLSDLEKVILTLRSKTGHDFSLYKKSTIYRRIERRMGLHQLSRIADYVRYLRSDPHESELLFRDLLIGVTRFFRDPAVWEQLKDEVFPELLATHPLGGVLRAWTPGCSSGEEAYSLAMVFREALDKVNPDVHYTLQIFATDLDQDSIDTARAGVYPVNISADVSEARLLRFFVQEERGYRICKEIREMVIFAPQNVVMNAPFTKLDLLSCRNLLIYLESDLQKKLLPLFHYSLNPDGILVLGNSETVEGATDLFAQLPGQARIYKRQNAVARAGHLEFPTTFSPHIANALAFKKPMAPALLAPTNLKAQVDALLMEHYTPPAVLTTSVGDIVYISGRTGKYLEPAAGKPSLNVFNMAREGLGGALSEIFSKAVRENATLETKGIKLDIYSQSRAVDVTVQPLTEPAALKGLVLTVFVDAMNAPSSDSTEKAVLAAAHDTRVASLPQELHQAQKDLQTTREEMQTSQEELKSTNEELHTVNAELRANVNNLSQAGDDMKNLLDSTDIATLFLDAGLKVRRFTRQTTQLFKLIPGDVGRPITDLVTELEYPSLAANAREVLRSLLLHEQQVLTHSGAWFTVRIMPYRTQDNRIAGVVITFVDISAAKALEASLREALAVLQSGSSDQPLEPEKTKVLESALQQAKAFLGKR